MCFAFGRILYGVSFIFVSVWVILLMVVPEVVGSGVSLCLVVCEELHFVYARFTLSLTLPGVKYTAMVRVGAAFCFMLPSTFAVFRWSGLRLASLGLSYASTGLGRI